MANYRVDFCVFRDMVDNLLQAPYGQIDPTGVTSFVAVRQCDYQVVALVFGRDPTCHKNEVQLHCVDTIYIDAACLSCEELCFVRQWACPLSKAISDAESGIRIVIEIHYGGCKGCGPQICGCKSC